MNDNAPKSDSQLLTPARLCWVLDVGESTEAAWREAKLISFFKQGRTIRYEPEAVAAFIARHTTNARAAIAKATPAKIATAAPAIEAEAWAKIQRLIADQVRAQLTNPQLEKAA